MYEPSVRGQDDSSLPGSMRRLGADLINALSQRVELVSVEMRLAQRRALLSAVLGFSAAFVLLVGVGLLTAALVVHLWPSSIVTALLTAAGIYLIVGGVAALLAATGLKRRPLPMQSLLNVLKEDKEWLLGRQSD